MIFQQYLFLDDCQTLSNYIQLIFHSNIEKMSEKESRERIGEVSAENATSSSKKKYEFIWKGIFIVTLIVASILMNKVYIFQTHPHFDNIRQGNIFEMITYGLPYAFVFTVIDWLIHYYFDGLCEKYYITEQRYTDPESRKKRCYTLVKWGYSIIYYLISSLWAYKILIGTHFMPTWLGGLGSPYSMIEVVPAIPDATFEMKVFYIAQFGKHFSRFFGHLFIRSEGNFFEYALHHGLSIFLIVFSYLTNQWLVGIFVLFIHDYSDFALILARSYKDYKHYSKILLDVIYVHAMTFWIGFRIILFLVVCIIPSFYALRRLDTKLTEFQLSVIWLPGAFMAIMECLLLVLHLFWTYYIAESFISVKISSKLARHSYD